MTKSPHSHIDVDLQIQRLVDGELSLDARRDFLAHAEKQDLWRRIAIQFVEEQSLQDCRIAFTEPKTDSLELNPPNMKSTLRAPLSSQNSTASLLAPRRDWGFLASMAASLLLLTAGFSIGYLISRSGLSGIGQNGQALVENGSTVGETNRSLVGNSLASQGSAASPELTDENSPEFDVAGGELKSLRMLGSGDKYVDVPIKRVDELDNQSILGINEDELLAMYNELRSRGIRLDYEAVLLNADLPDGRSVVMPVRDVKLTSVGY